MNSLASALHSAPEVYITAAFPNGRGLHEKRKWKVTVRTARNPEKRLESAPHGLCAPRTKLGIFLPGKVTSRPSAAR